MSDSPSTIPGGEGLSFEKVWAMFQETDREIKETGRLLKETRLQMKETDRQIGALGNRFGELAEHLVTPSIMEKFNALGSSPNGENFHFTRSSRDHVLKDPQTRRFLTEVDILLENGDVVIAVEVKAKLVQADIAEHLERMEILRRAADSRQDKRKYRGALAGAIVSEAVRNRVLKTGFYLIEQTGDTVKISIPPDFKPREW
jgi:hypothetical protein